MAASSGVNFPADLNASSPNLYFLKTGKGKTTYLSICLSLLFTGSVELISNFLHNLKGGNVLNKSSVP